MLVSDDGVGGADPAGSGLRGLARDAGYSRRVLAILRYLASWPVPPVEPGVTRPDS
jgi:hypothetical protein